MSVQANNSTSRRDSAGERRPANRRPPAAAEAEGGATAGWSEEEEEEAAESRSRREREEREQEKRVKKQEQPGWHESLKCACCKDFPKRSVYETDCCHRVLCGLCVKNRDGSQLRRCPVKSCGSRVFWCHRSRTLKLIIDELPFQCLHCDFECPRGERREHLDGCTERQVECQLCGSHRCQLGDIVEHLKTEHNLSTVRKLRDYYRYCF